MRTALYHTGERFVTAVLDDPGRKWTHMVFIDCPIRLVKVSKADAEKYSRDCKLTVRHASKGMLESAENLGITKGAREVLERGLNHTEGEQT